MVAVRVGDGSEERRRLIFIAEVGARLLSSVTELSLAVTKSESEAPRI